VSRLASAHGLVALGLLTTGCGSSAEPTMPALAAVPPPGDAGAAPEPPRASKRTLRQVGLFGSMSTSNLLLDPTFDTGSPGIGRWYSNLGTGLSGNGPDPSTLVTASAPEGMALPVATVADVPETGAPRTFTLLAQVPGGTGPYVVSLWLSTERPLDGELSSLVRVSLATVAGSLTGAEIPRDVNATRTIAGRTWHRYQGEVPGNVALGAFLVVRFKGSKNRWWLQAPSVVPKGLLAAPTAFEVAASYALDDAERSAVRAYRRMPLDFGVGRPR
jgi:hypothetical protein